MRTGMAKALAPSRTKYSPVSKSLPFALNFWLMFSVFMLQDQWRVYSFLVVRQHMNTSFFSTYMKKIYVFYPITLKVQFDGTYISLMLWAAF